MFSLKRYGAKKNKPSLQNSYTSKWLKILICTSLAAVALNQNLFAMTVTPPATNPELVTNGRMATDASGWMRYSPISATPSGVIFTKSGLTLTGTATTTLMVLDTRKASDSGLSNNVYQKVSVLPNTRYRIKFLARAEANTPADMFVRIFKGTDPQVLQAETLVTRRVRISDSTLTAYIVDFETGSTVSGDYSLSFSGSSNLTYTAVPGGQVGFTDVSLIANVNDDVRRYIFASFAASVDVNQAGYLGKNKPFVFTVSGLPADAAISAASLTRIADNGAGVGVNVIMAGSYMPLIGNILSDKFDLESGQRVITMSFDTNSLGFPNYLVDDLQNDSHARSFGPRLRGYKVSVDFTYVPSVVSKTGAPTKSAATVESRLFPISKNIYSQLVDDALNYFSFNTAGLSVPSYLGNTIEDPAKGEQYRLAGHPDDKVNCRKGVDLFGNDFKEGCTFKNITSMDVHGGWYDAGDQGKYVVNGGVSLWTLQNLIERLQRKSDAMSDGEAKTKLISDINKLMKTSREELEFILRMQAPAGTTAIVPIAYQGQKRSDSNLRTDITDKDFGYFQTVANPIPGILPTNLGDTSKGSIEYRGGYLPRLAIKLNLVSQDVGGMVFQSVTDETWTGLPTAPNSDPATRVLNYPTSAATFNMAAVAAQGSRIWSWPNDNPRDKTFATNCLNAAQLAYGVAKARYENRTSIFRYEYSQDDWHGVEQGTGNLNGVNWVDNTLKTDAGPNFTWLASGAPLPQQWGGGGAYGDYRIRDEYYWASMELYLATAINDSDVTNSFKSYLSNIVPTGSWLNYEISHTPSVSIKCANSDPTKPPLTSNQLCPNVYSGFSQSGFVVYGYSWIKGFDWQNVVPLGPLSAMSADATRFAGVKNFWQTDTNGNLVNNVTFTGASATGSNYVVSSGPRFNLLSFAETLVKDLNTQAYRFAKNPIRTSSFDPSSTINKIDELHGRDWQYEWGSNGNVLNRAIILAIASDVAADAATKTNDATAKATLVSKSKNYADSAALSMDYIMGRNANHVSYVSGYGFNSVSNPHHRFWAKIMDANFPAVPEGVLFGGPNSRDISAIFANADFTASTGTYSTIKNPNTSDTYYFLSKAVQGTGCLNNNFAGGSTEVFAPQKCFVANPHSFATAEVAINWNAPLVWMAQFLNDYAQK